MKPVSSNIKPNNKCLNPVTTKCVTWDGPDIVCLDGTVLCKGQSVETTLYAIATKLCQVINELNLEGLNPCINNINDSTPVNISSNSSLQEVFSAIIQKLCNLTDRIIVLEGEECPRILVTVPVGSCFRNQTQYPNWNVENQPTWEQYGTDTIPVNVFAELAAVAVCAMLVDITALQSGVININQQIQDLWFTLENCANQCENVVLPTCTYDFTANPDGDPVTVQTAFSWLEKDYCELKGALGSTDEIVEAVSRQCPDLALSDRLSAGGQMTDIAGWIDNPITLADSVNNLWLTVCDMRNAVSSVLSGCCFSLCNFLEFGYDLVWDPAGNYVDVVFNGSAGPHLVYTSPQVPTPSGSPWNATPSPPGTVPAWVPSVFDPAGQSPVLITISDGTVAGTLNTGLTINQWATVTNGTNNGFRIFLSGPSISVPGYDKTSIDQTIQFQFSYTVNDGITTETCNIDQIDGLVYECCAPKAYPCDIQIENVVDPGNGVGLNIKISGIVQDTILLVDSTVTGATATTLVDTSTDFTLAGVSATGANGGSVVYLNYNNLTGLYDECRYVTSISGAGNDTLNLDSAWTTTPVAGDTYVVKDLYFSYAANNWQNCNCAYDPVGPVTYLTGFTVQVIEVTPTYNPNDPTTWNVAVQNTNVSFATIATGTGYPVTPGYIDANKEYAVAIFANYVCGQSENSMPVANTPILASVAIQFGTPTSPTPTVFVNTSASVAVTQITSNGVSQTDQTATFSSPAGFGLDLPTGVNQSYFRIQPGVPAWNNSSNIVPKNFCACGIQMSPGILPGTTWSQLREQTLGLYRGYEVSVLYNDLANNAVIPLLDVSTPTPLPYITNSLSDPNLTFISNTPNALDSPPALPVNGGIRIDYSSQPLLGTYPNSYYPMIVRYDVNKYKVNLAPKFHKINFTTYTFRIFNEPFSSFTLDPNLLTFVYHADCKKWDANAGAYVNRTDPAYNNAFTYTPTGLPPIAPGNNLIISFTAPANSFSTADYGDWAYTYLTMNTQPYLTVNPGVVTFNVRLVGFSPSLAPVAGSQYSCNVPNTITQIRPYAAGLGTPMISGQGGLGLQPIVAWLPPNQFFAGIDALVTEDYDTGISVLPGSFTNMFITIQ